MACHHASRQLVEDAWDEKIAVREEPPAQKRMKITAARMQQPLTDPGPLDILFSMALVLNDAVKETHNANPATKQVAETEDDKEEDSDEEEEDSDDANGIAYA